MPPVGSLLAWDELANAGTENRLTVRLETDTVRSSKTLDANT